MRPVVLATALAALVAGTARAAPGDAGVGMRVAHLPHGWVVVWVVDGTPAAFVGIRPRDVLVAVEGQPVADVDGPHLAALVRGAAYTSVVLTFERDGARAERVVVRAPAGRGRQVLGGRR
ncbi:MAG: PDZ domain-containing protein [Alphaproteobacteria bacterium]|nr:PDZ domain-containing protein [Alphaproteobacteria bacterium]